MHVARVTGVVTLDGEQIQRELRAEIAGEATLDKVSRQVTEVISGVVREEFPMFANPFILGRLANGVEQQVQRRGAALVDEILPSFVIPAPAPEVRRLRLLQTIHDLWRDGDRFLAICLVMFTIFFPIGKYVALATLLVGGTAPSVRRHVLAWLKNWGQWSMGDVFVVAFLVVYLRINTSVVRVGRLADIAVRVDVEPGLYLFAASVITAMVCSMLLTGSTGRAGSPPSP
jgi:hypothetical protein